MESVQVNSFRRLHRSAVAKERPREEQPVKWRQVREADRTAQRRKWNVAADRHDRKGQDEHRHCRGALHKWNLFGADHVHDQGLRQEAFDEPA